MNMKSIKLKCKKGNKPEKWIEEKDETSNSHIFYNYTKFWIKFNFKQIFSYNYYILDSALSNSYEIKINKLSSWSLSSKKLIPSVSNQAPSTSGLNYFKSMMQKSQAINKVNRLKTIVKLVWN